MSRANKPKPADSVRVTVRMDSDTNERVKYWAERKGMSVNEYILEAIDHMIRFENRDYDLPSAEIGRLNQLMDQITSLSHNVHSLEIVTTKGLDSLMRLTRGSNYLLDEDTDISGGE